MSDTRFDVVGIGNAIVDILGRCDDAFLAQHNAPKGHMRIVDDTTISALYAAMGPSVEISGGSAANTLAGIASFGGRAAFIGKVADDEFGRIFAHDIRAAGVTFDTSSAPIECARRSITSRRSTTSAREWSFCTGPIWAAATVTWRDIVGHSTTCAPVRPRPPPPSWR